MKRATQSPYFAVARIRGLQQASVQREFVTQGAKPSSNATM
jgi:hypothetical protein